MRGVEGPEASVELLGGEDLLDVTLTLSMVKCVCVVDTMGCHSC